MDGMNYTGQLRNKTAITVYGRAKHLIVASGSENLREGGIISWS